ncbi:hypothetical protein [Sandarakinorhabdus limnophila]|uniref:hypothetical protein n=1 Tax=Sandarakinorhabdus limnophila TaxID=210512 RepID=UPI0026EE6BFB|nr:hypothetical protein [Sandarakinorhabdus limnophila]MCM0031388.1 hypothetical protein [Sandarakinorhabdus limnophila]
MEDEDLQSFGTKAPAAGTRTIAAITEFIGKSLRKGGPAAASARPSGTEFLVESLVETIVIEVEAEVHGSDSGLGVWST